MIKKVIIPVGGLGTRFLPATKAQPKEMLPIIDKPIIQYLVEEAVASGISDIIFVTGRGKRAIEDHFDFSPELESELLARKKTQILRQVRGICSLARFSYVRQNAPRGDGDALLCASHLVGEEPIGVLFGDDIVASRVPCLAQMMKVFATYNAPVVALDRVHKSQTQYYGVVAAEPVSDNVYRITDIVEKPALGKAPSNLVIVGKYIFTPQVFTELRRLARGKNTGEVGTAFALRNLLKTHPVYGLRFEGKRYDCGSKIGFLKATVDFGLKHPEVRNAFRKYLQKISHARKRA